MPELFADYIGQEELIAYLHKILEHGLPAHAFLLSGPAGIGKCTLVEQFIAAWLKVPLESLRANPDVTYVTRETDDKTGEPKKQISISQIREVCERLGLSAVSGSKVAIIEEAHTMTSQAQNALLKTLEEPKGNTLIFLLADDMQALLPTIRSRVAHLPLKRVPQEILIEALVAREVDEAVAEQAASLSRGLPGVALLSLTAVGNGLAKQVRDFVSMPRHERIKEVAILAKGDEASAGQRALWMDALCAELEQNPLRYSAALTAILDAHEALRDNGNVSLALERIALALP